MNDRVNLINMLEERGYTVDYTQSSVEIVYNYLEEKQLFTEEELDLVTCVNGYTRNTLNDMIYARYGYQDLEQLLESE